MAQFKPRYHRHSIRLKGYDYTQPGAYFVTICAWGRECLYGDIAGGVVRLSLFGRIAQEQWLRLGRRFPQADFSKYVIMPNHVHGIMVLRDAGRGAGEGDHKPDNQIPPLRPYEMPYVIPGSLGAIVRAYKAAVTLRINAMRGCAEPPIWQRNYYEHIIRDEADLRRIDDYIQNNPALWEQDQLHPTALPNLFNQEKLHG